VSDAPRWPASSAACTPCSPLSSSSTVNVGTVGGCWCGCCCCSSSCCCIASNSACRSSLSRLTVLRRFKSCARFRLRRARFSALSFIGCCLLAIGGVGNAFVGNMPGEDGDGDRRRLSLGGACNDLEHVDDDADADDAAATTSSSAASLSSLCSCSCMSSSSACASSSLLEARDRGGRIGGTGKALSLAKAGTLVVVVVADGVEGGGGGGGLVRGGGGDGTGGGVGLSRGCGLGGSCGRVGRSFDAVLSG